MFFLWIECENSGTGHYLPETASWSGRLEIRQPRRGHSVELPVAVTEGVYSISLPEGFTWIDGQGDSSRELKHCTLLSMRSAEAQLDIYAAEMPRGSTAMRKYALAPQVVTIGSREDRVIRYAQQPVSRCHAQLVKRPDGSCQLTDQSRQGCYVNGRRVRENTVPLNYGDTIVILPSLCILYLGDILAVSRAPGVSVAEQLPLWQQPALTGAVPRDASVICEYHRAPRHVQQPLEVQLDIDAPIEKSRRNALPTWLAIGPSFTMVLPMLLSGLVTGRNMLSSIVMIGTSSALAVMWGTFNRRYQKKQEAMSEEQRVQICTQYYAEMEERLMADARRERERLLYNYLSAEECAALPRTSSHRLWERMPGHSDFLTVRLGIGERELPTKIGVKQVRIALTDDPLRHEPQRLADQYGMIRDVPVLFSLMDTPMVGVLGSKEDPWLMQSIALQVAAAHSYHDVRLAVLYTAEDADRWAFAKWLPHCFASDERSLRLAVSEGYGAQAVLAHLDEVLSVRADRLREKEERKDAERTLPWYLIFCTDPALMENQPIVRHLTTPGLGATLVMLTPTIEQLPKECQAVIDARDKLGAVYSMNGEMQGVRFEAAKTSELARFSRDLAPMRIKEMTENTAIPSLVTFLETYQVRRVEELDIRYYWSENHAWQSVNTRIGLKAGSALFSLDISYRNHGPHGVIAGTTGAGKSVLLQAFILSLATNYSPTDVQFILIDYKGGGTSEDFRTLPHAAGIIDSLEGERMIYRALASIKGEIIRREQMFKAAGVKDIDEYMRYCNNDPAFEPLGHLVVIVDEFAELKKEKPEFMTELVSAARVGRSLGMHLVLATQKPSNSISDEIAANTRFRICLRVASKSDSSEMLHRPDAAYLKGMGRCYVQVGNDELFEQVQTSFPGADYDPDALRPEEEPRILNEAGQPLRLKRRKSAAEAEHTRTELEAVLAELNRVCDTYHIPRARQMWLKELGSTLLLEQIGEVAGQAFRDGRWPRVADEGPVAYYALADDIHHQRYIPARMDFLSEKNQIIAGLAGKGKTTLLQTVAVSLALRYSPRELHMYVFSLTSRMLSSLSALPHVGDIVYEDERDEQVRLMEMLHAECERRRKLFAGMATDNILQYNRAVINDHRPQDAVPSVVVLIDRVQQLRDWANNRLEDKLELFYDMLRSANSQGVYFVMTAFDRNELPVKYHPYVHGIALQLTERANYSDALSARIPPDWGGIRSYPGRGMIAVENREAKTTELYEIQTALYGTGESDAARSEMIQALGRDMRAAYTGPLPRGIARIPEDPTLPMMLGHLAATGQNQPETLPLGYVKSTGAVKLVSLREMYSMLVCGPRKSGKTNALMNIASVMAARGGVVHVVGSQELADWATAQGMHGYVHGSDAWAKVFLEDIGAEVGRRSGILKAAKESGGPQARAALLGTFQPVVILIDDLDAYIDSYAANQYAVDYLSAYVADNVTGYGVFTYATISHSGYQRVRIKQAVISMAQVKRGVMLGGKISDCDPFSVSLPFARKSESYPCGEGLLVHDAELEQIVMPRWAAE